MPLLDAGHSERRQDIPTSNQIWYWKEIGTLIAMIGMVLFLLAIADIC